MNCPIMTLGYKAINLRPRGRMITERAVMQLKHNDYREYRQLQQRDSLSRKL